MFRHSGLSLAFVAMVTVGLGPAPSAAGAAGSIAELRSPHSTDQWRRWIHGKIESLRIGVDERRTEVYLSSDKTFFLGCSGKIFNSAAQRIWTVRRISGEPGTLFHWPVVSTFPINERIKAVSEARKLRKAGFQVELIAVSAMNSTSLPLSGDTRRWYVTAGHFEREQDAAQMAGKLRKNGFSSWIHQRLGRPPSGLVALIDDSGKEQARGAAVRITGQGLKERADSPTTRTSRRSYRGGLNVLFDRAGLLAVVNVINLEDYLLGVVPAEMLPRYPIEALKAQAICSRSSALAVIGYRKPGDPFDLRSDELSQVYKGVAREDARTTEAVRATRGIVIVHDNAIVKAVFGDTCGGIREDVSKIWGGSELPFLKGGPDRVLKVPERIPLSFLGHWLMQPPPDIYCRVPDGEVNKYFRWDRTVDEDTILARLGSENDIGRLRQIIPGERGASGRVLKLELVGTKKKVTLDRELRIRQVFGDLPSSCIVFQPLGRTEKGLRFRLRGAGFGHGVGFCQAGAGGRATKGQDYKSIIEAYFPGTRLAQLDLPLATPAVVASQ